MSRTWPYVAGGGLGAVVLFELLDEGPVLVGLGAPHRFLTIHRLQGALTGHLAKRISVRSALWA